jgi:penicillin-binding protein 1B
MALEKSYNPATARLAMEVGMPRVVELAHDMGISSQMEPFPSVALGAAEVTPVELATVYATLAAGGVRPPLHGLVAVLDRYGKPVEGAPVGEPERVLSAQSAYIVTSLLQGVLVRGTARGAAAGLPGDLAGKTGTTNKRRDSWFGGYSPDRATVVWVGYDDNSSTRLSGARAALPLWVRFTGKVTRSGATFPQPPGLTTALIDPETGLLATEYCPLPVTEVFRDGEAPTAICDLHGSYWDLEMAEAAEGGEEVAAAVEEAVDEAAGVLNPEASPDKKRHGLRRWLRKVFGSGKEEKKEEGPRPPG